METLKRSCASSTGRGPDLWTKSCPCTYEMSTCSLLSLKFLVLLINLFQLRGTQCTPKKAINADQDGCCAPGVSRTAWGICGSRQTATGHSSGRMQYRSYGLHTMAWGSEDMAGRTEDGPSAEDILASRHRHHRSFGDHGLNESRFSEFQAPIKFQGRHLR